MGFLSAYSGVRRIELGPRTPDESYWVDLREHVSQGAKEKGDRALQSMHVVNGKPQVTPDVVSFRQELLLASVADWNLDDDNGTIWPLNMQSIKRLPAAVFDQLWEVVDATNAPLSTEERRRFPAGGVGGDPDGDAGAGEPVDVLAPAAVLAAPGDDEG
jgi:hypothetical protein